MRRKHSISVLAGLLLSAAPLRAADIPKYTMDKSFEVSFKSPIQAVATLPSGDIAVALPKKKSVEIIDHKTGKTKLAIPVGTKYRMATMTADSSGKIYVFCTEMGKKEFKINNVTRTFPVPIAVYAYVFDAQGKSLGSYKVEGAMGASSAVAMKDKLVLADERKQALIFLDPKTGKKLGEVKGFRLCCGIFGIGKGKDGNVLVANLGAFKVEEASEKGKTGFSFGGRGRDLEKFHGCCNPVNVSRLPNGCIVTAEKSPTRLKIYDPQGKKAVPLEGVGELVKGCAYIPMATDSDKYIYLALNRTITAPDPKRKNYTRILGHVYKLIRCKRSE
jgi:hypothetical protein